MIPLDRGEGGYPENQPVSQNGTNRFAQIRANPCESVTDFLKISLRHALIVTNESLSKLHSAFHPAEEVHHVVQNVKRRLRLLARVRQTSRMFAALR